MIHRFDQHKDNECHDQKVEAVLQEHAVVDKGFLDRLRDLAVGIRRGLYNRFAKRILELGEVHAPNDLSYGRHNDVVHHRTNNLAERSSNDQTDRQIDNIALHGKLFELFDQTHCDVNSRRNSDRGCQSGPQCGSLWPC